MNSRLFERKALQDEKELAEFCELLRAEGVNSYLEIGSKYGGSFWRVANALPKGSRVVAIDLPDKKTKKESTESRQSLLQCAEELKWQCGYDALVIWGNSRDHETRAAAEAFGPYDCILIDGDHELEGVMADWQNYSHMARKLVAFHDIAWKRAADWNGGYRIEVPEFWQLIKDGYRHLEIRHCHTGEDNGIGILWKP